jgi:hypothetical protein
MTTLYKLTDKLDQTYGGCQWGEGVTVETDGQGDLCGHGFTHWCTHPLLAVLLNPMHGIYSLATAHLWEGEGEIAKTDRGLKVGCARATTLRRVPLPVVTVEQRIRFAILFVKRVYHEPSWTRWADNWLSGADRSKEAADLAKEVVDLAADLSASTAASAAAWAASKAAQVADLAAGATDLSARAACGAASAAARKGEQIDLIQLAREAVMAS